MMRNEVEPKPNVRVSITFTQDESPHLGELIQPSAAAGADLAPVLLGFFTFEALGDQQVMDLLSAVAPQIQTLHLLSMLVKEDQVRVVVGNEVHLQPHIGVSMPGLLDEATGLRQLVQASARTTLYLCTPSSSDTHAAVHVILRRLQSQVQELNQVI